ncbi:restriction endonuclease subunit S [Mycoplasmopsis cynos]|uniref:restriction endonuclease subunit S n=1 Tax=Mycoplasmopsis cynos TaxID=171284 RepID=UPI002AFFDADE|nr:restriction endonuclease subunit S [Mycoplasmopsis cynos]WQQ17437.1 restriction endonuclease subunit S [Mycoplasmopsis cynos]
MTNVWEQEKIGNICEFKNGKAHENLVVTNGKYTLINSKFISSDGEISKTTNIQLTPLQKDEITIVLSDIPKGKALAKTFIIDKNNKYTLNQRIGSLKVISLNNVYFINLIINRNKYFLNFDDKINQTNLTNLIILECKVNLTKNISEQNKIAVIFNNINSLITLHQRELKILKNFKKSLFVKMNVGKNLTILPAALTKKTNVWEQERLGKISNFSTGKGITISQSLSKGFPIVSGGIDVMGYYSKYNRMENTITIARAGKCGYVSFISEKFYLNDKCFSLDLKENINSYFLFNLLKKNEKRIMELGSNSSIPTITSTSLKAVDIFRTSYDEQKAIAILFVSINSLIALHQRELKILKNFKKSLFQNMIVGKNLTILSTTLTKMTNVWEQERLGNLGHSRSGVSLEDHINNQSKYKFISIGSFGENDEYFDQGLRIVLNERTRKYLLNKNDLVMILNDKTQTCNILGRVLKIDKDDEYIHNQRTQRITLDNKLFLSGYFYFYINSNKFRNKIKQISQGNTQVYINWSIANKCVLKYPSLLDEQNKIAVIFNNINSLITLHQRELKILKNFKRSLFVKMIVGKKLTILPATLTKMTNVWEQEKIENICDRFDNYRIPISEKNRIKGNTPYYGANGIQDYVKGYTHSGENILIAEDGVNDVNNYSILYVNEKIWVNNHAHVIKASNKLNNNFFISLSLRRVDWSSLLVGGERFKLNASTLMNIFIKICNTNEQNKISIIFNIINSLIALHQREDSQSLNQGCLVILIVNIGKLHLCILVFYLLS